LEREKRRLGLQVGETSEDITKKRRAQRKEFKKERARKEKEAIDSKLKEEGKMPMTDQHEHDRPNGIATKPIKGQEFEDAASTPEKSADSLANGQAAKPAKSVRFSPTVQQATFPREEAHHVHRNHEGNCIHCSADVAIVDEEHLQLTPEEAFFLSFSLGVLAVVDPETGSLISAHDQLRLFRQDSYFPSTSAESLRPDDPFLISYVVYHHFRSLGWVVRPGIKFAVDYLLYNRGPVFSHAEFAVMILPSYSDPYWSAMQERQDAIKQTKGWYWLHGVNRVQTQVKKNLVLVYVEVPTPDAVDSSKNASPASVLKRYKLREVVLKRWIPNRSRD
jgi:tRNA-splicing endonuclease subunit Sen2